MRASTKIYETRTWYGRLSRAALFLLVNDMKHIICSSFGKDSNATALLALQHGEPLDEIIYTEVMFSKEITGELPEHARFIYETAIPYFEKRGIPTRVLHAEKTYLDCFYHVVSRGNAQGKLGAVQFNEIARSRHWKPIKRVCRRVQFPI